MVAFNEQVLLGRVRAGELKPGCTILLESMWRESKDPKIVASYVETYEQLVKAGYKVIEIPMERECRKIVADARRGKNMFALGMLCSIYSFDLKLAREQIALTFGKKDASVIETNVKLLDAGYEWAEKQSRLQISHSGEAQSPSRRSSSTATPRWRSACSPRAWKSAPCTRSRRRPRSRII